MNDIEKILTGGGMVFKKRGKTKMPERKRLSFLRGTHKSGSAKMKAEFKYKKHFAQHKKKNNCQLSIVNCQLFLYFCVRIDVDRFVLLATTGKMLKQALLTAVRQSKFPLSIHLFDLLTVNCKLSVDFGEFVLFDCQLSIVNCQFKKR